MIDFVVLGVLTLAALVVGGIVDRAIADSRPEICEACGHVHDFVSECSEFPHCRCTQLIRRRRV